jgi:aminoglycoside phosphotransferase family enzyme
MHLLDPAVYPDPTTTVTLVQTHISWVFITDAFAYKVKKPVDLGFLNFTTLRRRHFYLNQELTLNRRLCPEIYLEVLPIVAGNRGVRLGGPGHPVEYALKMVRLPQEAMMDEVADRGELQAAHLERIIERLVPFYGQAATGPRINKFGEPAIIHFNHQENFSRTAGLPGEILSPDLFDRIKVYSWGFLQKKRQLFLRRIKEGRIRDCHGDLHMKNICLADGVYIYDCIEFNPRFRYGDVAADIDFLAMDLDFHGYRQLSRHFVEGFARASRDPELLEIMDFYKCYRAYVRGKINAFVAQDPAQSPGAREQAAAAARAYFALAGEYAQEGAKAAA